MLYFTGDCGGAPAGRLLSNVFGTRYELALDPSVRPWGDQGNGRGGAGCAAGGGRGKEGTPATGGGGGAKPLVDVQYKTRLKGFMRPRRWANMCPFQGDMLFPGEQGYHVLFRGTCPSP